MVTLISALATIMLVYGGYTIYAENKYDFEDEVTVDTILEYHEEMNDLFNKNLKAVVDILKDPKGTENPKLQSPCQMKDFQEPDGTIKCEKKCMDDPENVSTYCVSVQAMDRYMRYIAHLNELLGSLNFESMGWSELRLTPVTDLIYQSVLSRDAAIEADIEQSRRVMEGTLAAYNEFMTAYPIHIRYKAVIKNLIKYKNKMKDIRQQVVQFPSTFIDATSTKCE